MISRLPSLPYRLKVRLSGSTTIEERFNIPSGVAGNAISTKAEIDVDGRKITDVRPLGISKSGNMSWVGYFERQRVKIYQAAIADQASFVRSISEHQEIGRYFPRVLSTIGKFVVAEWVDGASTGEWTIVKNPQLIDEMARMQAAFHKVSPSTNQTGFEYIDHLIDLYKRYQGPLSTPKSLEYIFDTICSQNPDNEKRLSHADVTLKNIIIEKASGQIKLIDNEFLTGNSYYSIDLFNTYRSIRYSNKLVRRYLEAYRHYGGDVHPIIENSTFFQALWGLRIIVTLMQARAVERAFWVADRMLTEAFESHPLISMIGELNHAGL